MTKKYILHVTHDNPENNMTIECSDMDDMGDCAEEAVKQGYLVRMEVRNED
jgi:hypothetical protein